MIRRALAITILAGLGVATPVAAQRSHIGLLAGPTASALSGSYVADAGSRELGFSFFATLDREFSDVWGIQLGVGWAQKGGDNVELAGAAGETWGYSTSYVGIPISVQAKFRFADGKLSLAPHAGIGIGIGMGCKVKPGTQFEFEDTCDETTAGGALQSVELSVPFGAAFSVEFAGGSRFTIVDVAYDYGISNVFTAAADAGQTARNGVLSFRFGFAMPLY
jgi:hypothetical protein